MLAAFVVGATIGGDTPSGTPVFGFEDPAIVESSGLVVRHGLFVTINDSGDTGRVFVVDDSGSTVGVTYWGGATDVEAVAPDGPGHVLVGDIGDNLGNRDSVRVVRVPVGRGDRDDPGTSYELAYSDGPQDAETLMVQPQTGRVVIVTKGIFGGRVLLAPMRLRTDVVNRLVDVGSALGVATDGSFFPDGRHFMVRDYSRAVVYTWPGLRPVARFPLPRQPQGEGIAIDDGGRVYLSSEGLHSTVLRFDLPASARRALSSHPAGAVAGPVTSSAAPAGKEPANDRDRPIWPWAVGGVVLLGAAVTLLRSLRRR